MASPQAAGPEGGQASPATTPAEASLKAAAATSPARAPAATIASTSNFNPQAKEWAPTPKPVVVVQPAADPVPAADPAPAATTMRSVAGALLPTNGAAPPPGEDEGSEGEGSEGEGSEGEEEKVLAAALSSPPPGHPSAP